LENKELSVESLLKDESFRSWVIDQNAEAAIYWNQKATENEDFRKNITFAKSFLLNLQEKTTNISDNEINRISQEIIQQNEESKLRFWKNPVFRVAASVAFLACLGYFSYTFINKNQGSQIELATTSNQKNILKENQTNEIENVVLEDGSVVALYPQSSIEYPSHFDAKSREVYLSGKAFFDIKRNPEQPFWVHTKKLSTQVLGTSFLVNAVKENTKVEVKTGKVSVYLHDDVKQEFKNQKAGVVLLPNQQVTLENDENRLVKTIVEQPLQVVELPKENFIFDEVPLKNVLKTIEKAYGLSITFDENKIENCFLTANLGAESLYEKLDLICKITHSSYEVVDAQIIVYSKGCN
jgi:transmembrane sensor